MSASNDSNSVSNTKNHSKKRILRQSLHLEVADNLRDMIVEGELPPGHRILEGDLCEQFGISRTPMREALKVLASEGLVEIKPNRGTRVTEITLEDIDTLFEALSGIERIAAELATKRMTERDLVRLKSLNDRMTDHFENGRRHEYFQLNQEAHNSIIKLTGNSILVDIHEKLMIKVRRARYLAILSGERWEESVKEHTNILEAMESRDAVRAGELILDHVRKTGAVVKESFVTENGDAGKTPVYAQNF